MRASSKNIPEATPAPTAARAVMSLEYIVIDLEAVNFGVSLSAKNRWLAMVV